MYLMMLLVGLDPRRVGTSRGPQPPAYMRWDRRQSRLNGKRSSAWNPASSSA